MMDYVEIKEVIVLLNSFTQKFEIMINITGIAPLVSAG